ncbi:MAG: cyclase family protein [Polyangiales bacterium]
MSQPHKLARHVTYAAVVCVAGCMPITALAVPPQEPSLPGPLAGYRAVDLTHVLDHDFPFIPVPNITFPFSLEPIATLAQNGVAANAWHVHEHLGTQIDAPNHFVEGGRALHQLRTDELFAPLVVLDVHEAAERDADYTITVADLTRWEHAHGRIPRRALVAMYAGWDQRAHDSARYLQQDAAQVMHFPGFSPEAATFLARERDIWGLGVDTISFDPGRDHTYQTHKALLAEDRLAVEAMANLQHVPERGAFVFLGAPNVRHATGGPLRVVALHDGSRKTLAQQRAERVRSQLQGTWRSKSPEPIGEQMLLVRELRVDGNRWSVAYTISSAGGPELRGRSGGTYVIAPGAQADGALLAEFAFDERALTPLNAATASTLVARECAPSAPVGTAVDVHGGCAAFRVQPVATCPREYDRVRVDAADGETKVFLGARPTDGNLCEPGRRPAQLAPPLVRVAP